MSSAILIAGRRRACRERGAAALNTVRRPTEASVGGKENRGADEVRLRGFSNRASVEAAQRWIDSVAAPLAAEEIDAEQAIGRVLARPLASPADWPPADRTLLDGYAVRAAETVGASDYNPISLALTEGRGPLARGEAALVAAGLAPPQGADAVLPFEAAHAEGGQLAILAAVAAGAGIEKKGQPLRHGMPLLAAGKLLRAQEAALLALFGIARVAVLRRPRIRLEIAGPKPLGAGLPGEANGPLLRALVARDGGVVTEASAETVIAVGRTGTGADDEAAPALAASGELAIHGVAMRPGGSAAFGRRDGVPVILLPGEPLACLAAYELFAGRLVRRLAGRGPGLPHPMREAEIGRKIVSAVGLVDFVQVALVAGCAEPRGSPEAGGLLSAVRADGFLLVPAELEGYAPGARADVYLYGQ
jgi:molybdopterin molybdotransferase